MSIPIWNRLEKHTDIGEILIVPSGFLLGKDEYTAEANHNVIHVTFIIFYFLIH